MTSLPYRLDRTVRIQATRETVFRFFTDPARWSSWWGAGSTIEARTGGRMLIRHPNGVEVSGEVLEVQAPERIVFTYGYASGKPCPPGSSRVSIELEEDAAGTRLHLSHEFADEPARDAHVQGWRFQLSLFGNAVANELHAGAAELVDAWFAAFAEPDETARAAALAHIAADHIRFRDRYSLIDGQADLLAQIAAYQRFMSGVRLQRRGVVRQCQGTAVADWVAVAPDGTESSRGTSIFQLGASGLIEAVTSVRSDE